MKKRSKKVKAGRVVLAGLAVTVFSMIVGMVTCGGAFYWVYKLEPTSVWKSMEGPPGTAFLIGSLILNIILATVYVFIRKGLPGKNRLVKGLAFGLCVWAVGILPGMFAMYSFMTVAATVLVYWTVMGLFQAPLEGLIIAAIYGN